MAEKDSLGDRMKGQYEDRARYSLPRRTYTILRLDGKAFHTFTGGLDKPFDRDLMNAMAQGALAVLKEAQGSQFAYIQSDEVSILLTDFSEPNTEAWFDGNLQKICSVAASFMTAAFNKNWSKNHRTAHFDCRAFTIPDYVEVENYFIWRQKDWNRNSIQMLARSHFSHKQLHEKGISDMHELLHQEGVNWNDLPTDLKNGTLIHYAGTNWQTEGAFTFTQERTRLTDLIPRHWILTHPLGVEE